MTISKNCLVIEGYPKRCGEYWRRYDQLVAKNQELVQEAKECNPETGPIIDEMGVIAGEISQHVRYCEQCQAWWRLFEVQK